MITRTWCGATRAEDADAYVAVLESTGVQECRALPGNRGVVVLRRVVEGRCEFRFLSFWDSWEAVKSFAGPEPERAVFYPEDDRFLIARDLHVDHFETPVLDLPAGGAIRDRHRGSGDA